MARAGAVRRLVADRGFGFIDPDGGGSHIFFHFKDLAEPAGPEKLAEGARVTFEVAQGERGRRAVKVRLADGGPGAADAVEEAVKGLKDALLATLQWVDLLDEILKGRG